MSVADRKAPSEREFDLETPLGHAPLLLWGLLSFWIYTLRTLADVLSRHYGRRAAWFAAQPGGAVARSDGDAAEAVQGEGFRFDRRSAQRGMAVNGLVAASLLTTEFLVDGISVVSFGQAAFVLLAAGALFGVANLGFLVAVSRSLRDHERAERQLLEQISAPGATENQDLAEQLADRWNAIQSHLVLICVVSCVFFIVPGFGAYQIAQLDTGQKGFLFHDATSASLGWALASLACGGLFHAWGTSFLVSLVNGHFKQERAWREGLKSAAHAGGAERPAGRDAAADGVRLLAIMFTDIKGYSKAMERDESHALELLTIHNRIVRAAIAQHAGREVKTIGDSFMVLFDSAVNAVQCGISLQRALQEHNRGHEELDRIPVRVGIHLGDVILKGGDVFGDSVNIAARLEGQADPGGLCVSADVYHAVRRKLKVDFVAAGVMELKNISNPPETYRVTAEAIRESGAAR